MTDKDFYMMGVKNCMAVLIRCLIKGGTHELIAMFLMSPEKFDSIAASKFDEHREAFIAGYKRDLEAEKLEAANAPTQPKGEA
jgi:hypothetical protein